MISIGFEVIFFINFRRYIYKLYKDIYVTNVGIF